METFSGLLALCAGNSPVPGEFPAQKPVTPSFNIFFDLRLNKRLSKQSRGRWFETIYPAHSDVTVMILWSTIHMSGVLRMCWLTTERDTHIICKHKAAIRRACNKLRHLRVSIVQNIKVYCPIHKIGKGPIRYCPVHIPLYTDISGIFHFHWGNRIYKHTGKSFDQGTNSLSQQPHLIG